MISLPGKFDRLRLRLRHAFGLSRSEKLARAGKIARESKLASLRTTAGAGKLKTAEAGAGKVASAGTTAGAGKVASAGTTAGAGKLAGIGVGAKLVKLLVLALPIGVVLLGFMLVLGMVEAVAGKILSAVRIVWRWLTAEPVLSLLVLASLLWLGIAGWMVFDHLQTRRIFIAAGSGTAESYPLAQAMKTVTERHYPRIRLVILEIEAAPGDAGMLEQGVIQLAAVPSGLPVGPSARSVAALPGSPQRLLLARNDLDNRVVYALTQVLTQFSEELRAVMPVEKAAPQPPAPDTQKLVVNVQTVAPLHSGAAEFYDREKTWLIFRYVRLSALVFAGLVLLGLWTWHLRRRARPKQTVQPITFSPPAEREPWTFSKILLESSGKTSARLRIGTVSPTNIPRTSKLRTTKS